MIIDSQIHVWLPESPQRPWPKSGVAPDVHLPYALTYPMLLKWMDDAGVDGALLVPPSWEGDRNDHALEGARLHPRRLAVFGRMTLDDPTAPAQLRAWKQQPGALGLRLTFVWDKDRAWLTDGSLNWFWPLAEELDIPCMVFPPYALPALGPIAERHPRLRLIVDHMGLNSKTAREGKVAENVAQLTPLAKYPNIAVKVSGLPGYSNEDYPFHDFDEPLKRVIGAFGPDRCFWGTDISRLLKKCTYRQAVTHFTQELKFLTKDDLDLIMGKALATYVGWPRD